MSFSDDVNDFKDNFLEASEETVKGTAIQLFSAIIKSSPVDEGTFRSNWFLTQGQPSQRTDEDLVLSEQNIINGIVQNVMRFEGLAPIYFTNNLPYSEVIEYGEFPDGPNTTGGYSRQAPQGVLRVNVLRFKRIFEQQAKKNGF